MSLALSVLLILCLLAPAAHADRFGPVPGKRGYTHVVVKRSHFYYRDGYYYRRHRGHYFLAPAPIGARVTLVPDASIRLRFGGVRYRYYGGIYYQYTPGGYVVVERPTTVYVEDGSTDTRFIEPDAETIMVRNSNGSQTPVRLEKINGQWKGPRGEVYDAQPTNEQLRAAYGF